MKNIKELADKKGLVIGTLVGGSRLTTKKSIEQVLDFADYEGDYILAIRNKKYVVSVDYVDGETDIHVYTPSEYINISGEYAYEDLLEEY